MAEELLRAEGVGKTFRTGVAEIDVLRGVDLSVAEGDRIAILGQSGVGKSTLLYVLGTLDRPTEGTVSFRDAISSAAAPTSWRPSGTSPWASCSSSITCCPSSMPSRTS